ncbi:hypothetical protein KYY02_31225 [Streptomyces pimonensis]|uniref:Uncharacterized protein n=1 Tax=Streptomyces pimonensis TaxID=2860288 RepID=A0ABV4J7V8_9ACTN
MTAELGTIWSEDRPGLPGAGVAVELTAVLELLAAVDRGEVRPLEAMAAFGPFVEAAADYGREMERIAELSWRGTAGKPDTRP